MLTRYRAFLLLLLILLLCTVSIYAQTPHTLPDGMQVSIPEGQEALPGQFITYNFILRNPTLSTVNLTLKAWTEHEWTLLGSEEELSLPPQAEVVVPVTIMVPNSAYGGSEEPLTLSLSRDGQTHLFQITTRIVTNHKITLEGPPNGQASPKTDAQYAIRLYNHGSSPEEIHLSTISENGWAVRVEPDFVLLQPGEQIALQLVHSVPNQVKEGTVDAATLIAVYGLGYREDLTIKTTALWGETPSNTELRIPLRSTLLWDFTTPEDGDDAYLRWTYRVNAAQDDTSLDFFIDGILAHEGRNSPDTLHLTWDSPNHYVKVGRFDPYWNGVLPTPTQNAMLRWDLDRDRTNLQFLVGAERDDEQFSDALRWLAVSASWPESPWTFRMVLPFEESGPKRMAEIDYAKNFGNTKSSWSLRSRFGLGWDDSDTKRAGDLILNGISNRWNLRFEYGLTDQFFSGYDRQRLYISNYYRWTPSLALESGYSWWETNAWSDPSINTTTHQGMWSRLNFHTHYSLYFGIDEEDGGINPFREPKAELRYARQRKKDLLHLNFIRRYRDYEEDDDIQYWTVEGHYRLTFNPQHYWDILTNYNLMDDTLNDEAKFRFRVGYSTPIKNTWMMSTYVGTLNNSGIDDSSNLTFRWEVGYRPNADGQWKLALSYNDEYTATDDLFIFLSYQGVFTDLFTPPWGSIQGIIFEDVNNNGRFDAQDMPIQAKLILNNKESLLSDATGRVNFTMVRVGNHKIALDLGESPYYATVADWDVAITRGNQRRVEIPVRRKPFLRGFVFKDLNGNNVPDQDDLPLAGARFSLLLDGKVIGSALSSDDGFLFFNNLLPGSYRLRIDEASVITQDVVQPLSERDIVIGNESSTNFDWGLTPVDRPIEFTFNEAEVD